MNSEETVFEPQDKEPRGKVCSLIRQRVPILSWFPKYDKMSAVADLVAGITLGLTLVPQSIAYASLAGLQVHYGLYSSFMGTLVYVIFGTVKEASIGPASLMALLTLQSCRHLSIDHVILLTFLSGCIVFVMGLLRLGFLVNLISQPVTSGFTSGSVVIIAGAQIKGLIGLKFTAENVVEIIELLAKNFRNVKLSDCILSFLSCTFILLLRKLNTIKVNPKKYRLKKALFFLSISRNALVVLIGATFAFCTTTDLDHPLVTLSGRVEPGLPRFSLPSMSAVVDNSTVYFPEMVMQLGSSLIMVPVVMVLANVAIAKAFSSGRPFDATQEMLTLGLCNIFGALVHSMPTCGAFTRSAVSHSSGVRTPFAGIYSATITLMALAFMTRYFYFIPKATLSSVLVCAIIFMFDFKIFPRLWRNSKPDFVVVTATFLVTVFWTLEMAVLTGILGNLVVLLYSCARPEVGVQAVKVPGIGECTRVEPALSLIYLNIEQFCIRVSHVSTAVILVDCSRLQLLDYCAVKGLENLVKNFKTNGQKCIIYNASLEVMARLEHLDWIDPRQLHAQTEGDAVNLCDAANMCDTALSKSADEAKNPLLKTVTIETHDENK